MKSVRVLFVVLGLSALPLFAVAGQGNGNGNQCKTTPSSPNGRGVGLATAPGQVKKCPVTPAAPPPNQQPAASFTFICSDLSCSFASTSTDPDGTISAYSWTFGDGGTSNAQNPSHSYGAAGSYSVTLTVTDNQGATSGPLSQTVNVTPPPPAPVPPPPSSPPSGINYVSGIVFEDLDGNGLRDPFSGEMGLEGWTVELWWNGQVLATTTTDVDGNYLFPNLGNATYSLCIQAKGGYTQTLPVGGTGCGGSGYTFTFQGVFQQMFPGTYAEMLQ